MSAGEGREGEAGAAPQGPGGMTLRELDEETVGWVLERFVWSQGREPGIKEELREVVLHGIVAVKGRRFDAQLMPDEVLDEARAILDEIDVLTMMSLLTTVFPAGPDGLHRLCKARSRKRREAMAAKVTASTWVPGRGVAMWCATCLMWVVGVVVAAVVIVVGLMVAFRALESRRWS